MLQKCEVNITVTNIKKKPMRNIHIIKFKRFLKKNKYFIWIWIFPLIIEFIYALPFSQIINVNSGDLLQFYATALGIYTSVMTYRDEKIIEKKNRTETHRPCFVVDIKKVGEVFETKITKLSKEPIWRVLLYDEYVADNVNSFLGKNLRIAFGKKIEEEIQLNVDYNICCDSDILDEDGYPKYFQIICDDVVGNTWNVEFSKYTEGKRVEYYPIKTEILEI
jgi:hypothetical protein